MMNWPFPAKKRFTSFNLTLKIMHSFNSLSLSLSPTDLWDEVSGLGRPGPVAAAVEPPGVGPCERLQLADSTTPKTQSINTATKAKFNCLTSIFQFHDKSHHNLQCLDWLSVLGLACSE